ncbi:HECT-type E3 ubiquitin transferase [Ranunculus cassubicifolius]
MDATWTNQIRLLQADVNALRADLFGIKDPIEEIRRTITKLESTVVGYTVKMESKTRQRKRIKGEDYVYISLDGSDDDDRPSKSTTNAGKVGFVSPSTPATPAAKRKVEFSSKGISSKAPTWDYLIPNYPNYLLNNIEYDVFRWLYDRNANLEETVVDFPSWDQRRETFKCLLASNWVSSEIMNSWCAYLNVRQTSSRSVEEKDRNFYFCTVDEKKFPGYLGTDPSTFEVVAALKHARRDFEVEEYRRWFVALVSKGHWWLYVFNLRDRTVMILDSLVDDENVVSGGQTLMQHVVTNVKRCLLHLNHSCMKNSERWIIRQREDAPQQNNFDDCGVYVMRYMDLWDGNWLKESILQDDIEYIRHHMAVKMVMAEENIARPWHLMDIPVIDINDMRANTMYIWYGEESPVIGWFWEVVQGFNDVDKARLLQFVTGTSKVPLGGFSELQGLSGAQKFQIKNPFSNDNEVPSAQTSFNQLDLPNYQSKQRLEEKLLLGIHEAAKKSPREWRGVRMISKVEYKRYNDMKNHKSSK